MYPTPQACCTGHSRSGRAPPSIDCSVRRNSFRDDGVKCYVASFFRALDARIRRSVAVAGRMLTACLSNDPGALSTPTS